VLPIYNEAANLLPVVGELLDALLDVVPSFEVIIVDDGSNDGTRRIAEELAATHREVRVLHSAQRRGYGVAWREGLAVATKQYALFLDPDRRYFPADLDRLVKWDDVYDLVAGFRMGSDEPVTHRLARYSFRVAARMLFGLKLRDVNCGFKLVRMSLLRELELQFATSAIHSELLARAIQNGARVREVGVQYMPRASEEPTSTRFRWSLRTVGELSRLRAALVRDKRQAALEAKARREGSPRARPAPAGPPISSGVQNSGKPAGRSALEAATGPRQPEDMHDKMRPDGKADGTGAISAVSTSAAESSTTTSGDGQSDRSRTDSDTQIGAEELPRQD